MFVRGSTLASMAAIAISWCVLLPAADRVDEILAAARQAAGGADRLAAVKTLTVSGVSIRRPRPGTAGVALRSRIEIAFQLPDRYLFTHEIDTQRAAVGFNGERLIQDPPLPLARDDTEQATFARMIDLRHGDFLRLAVAWLLTAPAAYDVRFADAGDAMIGGRRVALIDATSAQWFDARLAFDSETHRLLEITSHDRNRSAPPPPARAPGDADAQKQAFLRSLDGPDVKTVTTRMQFSEYRADNGIVFPHRMRIETGPSFDEWELSRFKVNTTLNADWFERR